MTINDVSLHREVITYIVERLPPDEIYDPKHFHGSLSRIIADAKQTICPRVSKTTLYRWWRDFLWLGDTRAAFRRAERDKRLKQYQKKSNRGGWTSEHTKVLKEIVDNEPDLYLDEIQEQFICTIGEMWSISSIYRKLRSPEINYSLQVATDRATQQEKEQIDAYFRDLLYWMSDPSQLIFVDESAKDRNSSRRRRSWSRRGLSPFRRAYFAGSHARRYTLIAACDINGFVLDACETVLRENSAADNNPTRGTIDGERFKLWVEEKLIPVLGKYHAFEPRSIVVLDNASVHHVDGIQEMIEEAGAKVVFTAPYSPEYNPIETMFHIYKSTLRRHRGLNWLDAHCLGLEAVTPKKARALFRHAKVPYCEHFPTMTDKDTNNEEDELAIVAALVLLLEAKA